MKLKLFSLIFCGILAGACHQTATAQKPVPATLRESYAANQRQREEFMREYGLSELQALRIQQFSRERTLLIEALAARDLPGPEMRAERDAITDAYYQKIAGILTPEQRAQFRPEAYKAVRTDEIKGLNLPREKALEMGGLKAGYEARIAALNAESITPKERKSQKELLDKEYRDKLRELLGAEKYAEWLHFKNTALERKYKTRYGFTTAQFNKYKEIENKTAVDLFAIRQSAKPADEKATKTEAVKESKVESLRAILPSGQFEKWYADYMRTEQKHREKKQ